MTGRPALVDYHGTITGYRNRGCKCDRCLAAHRRAVTSWRLRSRAAQTKAGKDVPVIPQRVDADPVVAHVRRLHAEGMSYAAIAEESGVSDAAVARIARGHRRQVWRTTAERILAVAPLPDLTDYVDPVVVERLLAGADWRELGASRAERIAAAETVVRRWSVIRAGFRVRGWQEQSMPGMTIAEAERHLGLKAGRDFATLSEVAS